MTTFLQPLQNSIRSPTLNTQLLQLQNQHKDMQQSLKERIDSLKLHLNLSDLQPLTNQLLINNTTIQQVLNEHSEIHCLFSEQLLRNQVQIQEQAQMNEIIKNYQKRIFDLRAMLINKQTEITFQIYERKRQSIAKKQNILAFNNQISERAIIKKHLQQLKKLKVEVDALEHTLTIYSKEKYNRSKLTNQNNEFETKEMPYNQSQQDKVQIDKIIVFGQQRSSNLQKDVLLARLVKVLEEENERESRQKIELDKLKGQWEKLGYANKQLSKKYKKMDGDRTKMLAASITVPQKIQIASEEQNMNILQEIQKEIQTQVDAQTIGNALFAEIDRNVEQPNPFKVQKSNRRTNLRQKRRKVLKQNC